MSDDKDNDPIGKKLGLVPMASSLNTPTTLQVSNMLADAHDDSVKADFDYARGNVMKLIEDGNDAIFKLAQIAEQSQNPRAYEVLATIFTTMLKANQDLMDLQKKSRDLGKPATSEGPKTLTNNNLFVGTNAELAAFLENMRK